MSKFEDDDFFEEDLPDNSPLLDNIDEKSEEIDGDKDPISDEEDDLLLEVEPSAKKKIKAKVKPKDKPYYLEPEDFHNALKDYIVLKAINPEAVINNKLGRMIVKIVEGVFSKNNFRNYFNGWDVEMKSRAYEHICKYAHRFNIYYCETTEFFLKWMFRVYEQYLEEWFNSENFIKEDKPYIYSEFKKTLKDVKVQSFKKKSDILLDDTKPKTKKSIEIVNIRQVYADNNKPFDEASFAEFFFEKYSSIDLQNKFIEYKKRNAFNYFTKIAIMAGKHTIKVEGKKNDVTLQLDEAIYYRTNDEDDDIKDSDNRFTSFNEECIDWGG